MTPASGPLTKIVMPRSSGIQRTQHREMAVDVVAIGASGHGCGDVSGALTLAEWLARHGWNVRLRCCSKQTKQILDTLAPSGLPWLNRDAASRIGRGRRVLVCPGLTAQALSALQRATKNALCVQWHEFGPPFEDGVDEQPNVLRVFSGLEFDASNRRHIQAGPHRSAYMDSLLNGAQFTSFRAMRTCVAPEISSHLRRQGNVVSAERLALRHWSVFYTSHQPSQGLFFRLVKHASTSRTPVVVYTFCLPEMAAKIQRHADMMGLEFIQSSGGWPAGGARSWRQPVVIMNLGRVDYRLFARILLAADWPSVVTGDMSLSLALQKCASRFAAPFFYHVAPWKICCARALLKRFDHAHNGLARMLYTYMTQDHVVQDVIDGVAAMNRQAAGADLLLSAFDVDGAHRWRSAACSIVNHLRQERREALSCGDVTAFLGETVEYILRGLAEGSGLRAIRHGLSTGR